MSQIRFLLSQTKVLLPFFLQQGAHFVSVLYLCYCLLPPEACVVQRRVPVLVDRVGVRLALNQLRTTTKTMIHSALMTSSNWARDDGILWPRCRRGRGWTPDAKGCRRRGSSR